MKTPEPTGETFLCERCWNHATGDQHCVDGETTICDACLADHEKLIEEIRIGSYLE